MALPLSPSSVASSASLSGPGDAHPSISGSSLGTLRWRGGSCNSSSLVVARASLSDDWYGGNRKEECFQARTPLRYTKVFHSVRYGHRRRNPGVLLTISPRRTGVKARLETQDGAESTDALPYSGRDAIKYFFDSARSALIDKFKTNDVGREVAALAVPAILAQAVDPAAQLVQTAYVGRLGPVELAAVGVSISVFNLVSKMFNIPLLNITTSFVAEDEVAERSVNMTTHEMDQVVAEVFSGNEEKQPLILTPGSRTANKRMLPSVSSSLVLGTFLGLFEAAVLVFATGPVLYVMGITADSPMRLPAEQYLALRAFGAPAVVLALAVQGVFRGFKDTKTPLYSSVAGNVANVILDPILIFSLHYGVGGAAVATVVSQYLIVGLLLWSLNKRVVLLPPSWKDLKVDRFLKSGGLLLGRTVALLVTMTLATSMAARQGPIPMAAHQICLQIWLATSLLSDGLALAAQAILAGSFAEGNSKRTKEVTIRVLQMGLIFGVVMAIVLAIVTGPMSGLFTDDPGVLKIVPYLIPFVAATQPINSLAFVFDGLHYGASDFGYAAYTMILTAIPSITVLLLAPRWFGLTGVWIGLTVVMTLRMAAGFARIGTASGPWKVLKEIPEKQPLQ